MTSNPNQTITRKILLAIYFFGEKRCHALQKEVIQVSPKLFTAIPNPEPGSPVFHHHIPSLNILLLLPTIIAYTFSYGLIENRCVLIINSSFG